MACQSLQSIVMRYARTAGKGIGLNTCASLGCGITMCDECVLICSLFGEDWCMSHYNHHDSCVAKERNDMSKTSVIEDTAEARDDDEQMCDFGRYPFKIQGNFVGSNAFVIVHHVA